MEAFGTRTVAPSRPQQLQIGRDVGLVVFAFPTASPVEAEDGGLCLAATCAAHLRTLEGVTRGPLADRLLVFGVSQQSRIVQDELAARLDLTFTLVSDVTGVFKDMFGLKVRRLGRKDRMVPTLLLLSDAAAIRRYEGSELDRLDLGQAISAAYCSR
jgi:peroxiredoxin